MIQDKDLYEISQNLDKKMVIMILETFTAICITFICFFIVYNSSSNSATISDKIPDNANILQISFAN